MFVQFLIVLIDIDLGSSLNGTEFLEQNSAFSIFTSNNWISPETLGLITNSIWARLSEGLSLSDIEGCLIFILFLRFIILAIRYNLKTSFYITCIGLVAGYLWYRHFIDLLSMYRNTLLNIPFLENLGLDSLRLREYHYQMAVANQNLGTTLHWYDFGSLIYYAFVNGIIDVDSNTGLRTYIDPLSMIVSNLDESMKITVLPIYYKIYNQIVPRLVTACSNFWSQLSGIAAYALITRIGKRYCPYLIRWHWTFLLVASLFEPFIEYFVFRAEYFEEFILKPRLILTDPNLEGVKINEAFQSFSLSTNTEIASSLSNETVMQIIFLNGIVSSVIIIHVSLVLLALFHAIWGQYFYVPFLTENVELHIGPRPKQSIYSGGYSSWQDNDEKRENLDKIFPKLWYGWFGRGTKTKNSLFEIVHVSLNKIFAGIKRIFK